MKNIKFFILFIAIALISCERDDICAATTQTTPRLIIEFYDATELEDLKNVPRLTVYGEGLFTDENGVTTEPTETSDNIVVYEDEFLFNDNFSKIGLPLIVGLEGETTTTRFVLEKDTNLRLDTTTTETSNKDIIEISYVTQFIYVSRACGYKSIFTELSVTRVTDSEPWLNSGIEIEDTIEFTVENENTTHVRIFH